MKRFREEVADGKMLCRDIAGVDWTDQDQVKAFREGPKREACGKLTGRATRIVGEIIDKAVAALDWPA